MQDQSVESSIFELQEGILTNENWSEFFLDHFINVQFEPSQKMESSQGQLTFGNVRPGTSTEGELPGTFNLRQKYQIIEN